MLWSHGEYFNGSISSKVDGVSGGDAFSLNKHCAHVLFLGRLLVLLVREERSGKVRRGMSRRCVHANQAEGRFRPVSGVFR